MKHLKTIPLLIPIIVGLLTTQTYFAQDTISLDDFKVLNNTSWEGTLTYLDYQSGKLVPVASTMQVNITDQLIQQNVQYTWEPDKNVQAKTKIKKNGTYLGDQKVLSKSISADGTIQLLTSYDGMDDNKKATMFYTYKFNGDHYKVTKEVLFEGSYDRIMRNTYDYRRL